MRALLQRVRSASVEVDGETVGKIGPGLLVLLGVGKGDSVREIDKLADKIIGLRIFPDDKHSMNRSVADVEGEVLLVSQFTLFADCRKGRRPSFEPAELPERAEEMCEQFARALEERGFPPAQGVFGAHMNVRLETDGPVTIWLDTDELGRARRAESGTSSGSGA